MPEVADTRASAFAALRYRNYRLMWISAIISSTGRWFQVLAIPLIVYDLTGGSAASVCDDARHGAFERQGVEFTVGVLAERGE